MIDTEELKRLLSEANPQAIQRILKCAESSAWRIEELRPSIEAIGAVMAAAPKMVAEIEGLRAENERLDDRNVEAALHAYKWMAAHDALKDGKPYDYPSPADVPNLITERDALKKRVRELEAGLKTIACDCARCCLVEQWELPGAGGRCAYYRARALLQQPSQESPSHE